jgi:acetyl-CoA carboxylase carboxyl transferase beta subunit/acetyl-CoA carboxylase carboxyl transferase alpha subunit
MVDTFSQMRARLDADKKFHEDQQVVDKTVGATEAAQAGMKDRFSYLMPIPDDLWIRCPSCQGVMLREDFEGNRSACLHCGHCFRVNAKERIDMTVDEGSFEELWKTLYGKDPISFPRYEHRLSKLREKTGMTEAVIVGKAAVGGHACMIGAMDSNFLMGSMGSAVGEKITRLFEEATRQMLPVLLFSSSGGARMQEGIVSLMQMAKTSAAVERHHRAGLLFLSIMTDPTTGGVTASFASLGDIILSEPGTLIGFAGRRVIEGTIAQALPDDFQRAEFIMKHGFLDIIVPRSGMRQELIELLSIHGEQKTDDASKSTGKHGKLPPLPEHRSTGSECLSIIRNRERPTLMDYLPQIFTDMHETHGDRSVGDDPAMYTGIGRLDGRPVTIIGHRKGKGLLENQACNYGMPHPEGYRKALRAMKQAEKFGRPVITFVDTPGAYCGVAAEERGQGEAIARNLLEMMPLTVPVISVVLGEGGSGGALGIAVCDELAMTSNAIYSVISPRGFASLIWKDPTRENEAADTAHITAYDLMEMEICDIILAEPKSGAHADPEKMAETLKTYVSEATDRICRAYEKDREAAMEARYQRFRKIGDCS